MFFEVLTGNARTVLEKLALSNVREAYYLAGGTAAALQMGHRRSEDFDFFSSEEFSPMEQTAQLAKLGEVKVLNQASGTLHVLFDGVRVSFLRYSYPLLMPTHRLLDLDVADVIDIALMKVAAIAGRGSKKDFIDLYWMCRSGPITLAKLPSLFAEKFKEVQYSAYHIARSLTFFEDADPDPMPEMLANVSWEQVKAFFVDAKDELEGWYTRGSV